nr:MAG TPA: hypothetical protein [Bacteriophage sp.]
MPMGTPYAESIISSNITNSFLSFTFLLINYFNIS